MLWLGDFNSCGLFFCVFFCSHYTAFLSSLSGLCAVTVTQTTPKLIGLWAKNLVLQQIWVLFVLVLTRASNEPSLTEHSKLFEETNSGADQRGQNVSVQMCLCESLLHGRSSESPAHILTDYMTFSLRMFYWPKYTAGFKCQVNQRWTRETWIFHC